MRIAWVLGGMLVLSGCGTLVQVVNEAGSPVEGAAVALVWPSVNGEPSITDAHGYARLRDGWSMLGDPHQVVVTAAGRHWHIDYPPPLVIHLRPSMELREPAEHGRAPE